MLHVSAHALIWCDRDTKGDRWDVSLVTATKNYATGVFVVPPNPRGHHAIAVSTAMTALVPQPAGTPVVLQAKLWRAEGAHTASAEGTVRYTSINALAVPLPGGLPSS
jgi:hypothetical protein